MKEVITEHNYLFINEANICQCDCKITFTLKNGTRSKVFSGVNLPKKT